jgi:hypothetical protein
MSTFERLEFRDGFAGGCNVNGILTCVAQPQDYCDEGTYVPAHFLRANTGHPLRYCAGDLESVIIGRCGGKCTNLQSRCVDNDANDGGNGGKVQCEDDDCNQVNSDNNGRSLLPFIEYDPTCTTTQDLLNDEYVTYGKCGDRCVWSKEDCLEGEVYIQNDDKCTADKVQIGACFAGHAYCSVSKASCTQINLPDEPYMTHQEVKEKIGANCYLSSLPAPPTESPPPPPPTESPVMTAPTVGGYAVFDEDGNPILVSSSNKNGGGGLQMGALVAIVAIVAVLIGAVIGVGAVRLSKKRKDQHAKDNAWKVDSTKRHTLPMEDIEMSTNPGMDGDVAESELSVEIIE